MRQFILALALLAAACGQTSPTPTSEVPEDARAGSSGAGNVPEQAFTLEAEALVGLWSFDRTCGLFDLDFAADGAGTYYDYSSDMVRTHRGTWATADNNRVVLTTRVLDANGVLGAETTLYNLDVTSPVTGDLTGRLSRADGAEAQDITAKRCDDLEDRD